MIAALDFCTISKNDINQILEIEKISFDRPWSHSSFVNELLCKQAFMYAAKRQNADDLDQIIAYLCFRLYENEMHILKIAVQHKWRRHGVASRLLERYLKDASKKTEAAFLEVRFSNTPAIAFYNKLGFTLIGRRPGYYSDSNGTEDALLMMKVLKEAT